MLVPIAVPTVVHQLPWFSPRGALLLLALPSSQPHNQTADARRGAQDRPSWAAEGLVLNAPSTTATSIGMGEAISPIAPIKWCDKSAIDQRDPAHRSYDVVPAVPA